MKKILLSLLPLCLISATTATQEQENRVRRNIIINAEAPGDGISSLSGTASHGNSVTISGAGFGSKSTAAPQLWDTVENQSTYSGLSDGDTIPDGGSYPWYNNASSGPQVKMETTDSQRGQSSEMYKIVFSGNSGGGLLESYDYNNAILYLSWWFKASTDWQGGSQSNKILRMNEDASYVPSSLQWSWTEGQFYAYHGSYLCEEWDDWGGNDNSWNRLEILLNANSTSVTGRAYTNGSLTHTCAISAPANTDCVSIGLNPNSSISVNVWFDDVYIDTVWTRVELCSGSTWSSKGTCEIQPASSWSSTSIAITFNQGAFANSSTAYLYIIDSSNSPVDSDGYGLTIGDAY